MPASRQGGDMCLFDYKMVLNCLVWKEKKRKEPCLACREFVFLSGRSQAKSLCMKSPVKMSVSVVAVEMIMIVNNHVLI